MMRLHQRIRSDIESKILSGEWRPGTKIPSEHQLMQDYDCARMTVNKALSSLVAVGLIERRRRAGSFVRAPVEQSALLEIPDIKTQIAARGLAYGYELLSRRRRRANEEEQQTLALAPGADLLLLECRHLAAGLPFAVEQRRIMLDAIPDALGVDFADEPPGSWLLGHVPWHEAEHKITARPADPAMADKLGITDGTACLVVDRRTWRSGALLTAVRLWYPGDQCELVAKFTPARS
jgi:GntR family histidine utilization transcriptional repressor